MAFRFYIDERALLRMDWKKGNPTLNPETLAKDGSWRPGVIPSPYTSREVDRDLAQECAREITGEDEVDLDAAGPLPEP